MTSVNAGATAAASAPATLPRRSARVRTRIIVRAEDWHGGGPTEQTGNIDRISSLIAVKLWKRRARKGARQGQATTRVDATARLSEARVRKSRDTISGVRAANRRGTADGFGRER